MQDAAKFAVFIQGLVRGYDVWFRVELENTKKSRRKMVRKRISPVAVLEQKTYGVGGSWEVIGDDIYWIGGWIMDEDGSFVEVSKRLLKHNINSSDIRSWETVSTSMKLPRASPVITSVGENKLYVLLGDDRCRPDDNNIDNDDEEVVVAGDVDWNKCGEIYDIENGTWEYLAPDVERFSEYDPFHTAIVKEVNSEQPKDIAFFSFHLPMMYFKLAEQTLETPNPSCHLSLNSAPTGPQGCNDIILLLRAVNNFKSVFDGNTWYWFAGDMRLYGYDVDCQCWLLSPSLEDKFHHLEYPPYFTMLYALGNGKLVVIVDEPGQPGFFTMATLEVHRDRDKYEQGQLFLSVSVKSLQAFHLDHNQRFRPSCAKAVKLKNTAMRGQRQVTDDVHPLRKMVKKIDSRTKAFISMSAVGALVLLLLKSRN